MMKLLLTKNDIDLNIRDIYSQTLLLWATENRHEAVVKLLLAKKSIDPDFKNSDGQTLLSRTARNGREAVVKLLLAKNGVNPNVQNKYSQTPLCWAAGNGHEAVVKLLLVKDGVDPDCKNKHTQTSLSWTACNGHKLVVKLLLAIDGIDPESKDTEYGHTPLWWAASNGHQMVVELLIHSDSVTLHLLAQKGIQELVKILLAAGYDVNTTDSWKRTPLHYAVLYGNLEVAKELTSSANIDINSEDGDHMSPLRLAIRQKKSEFTRLLLQKCAHTRRVMVKEWLDAFNKEPPHIVVLSEELRGETSVRLIAKEELEDELEKDPAETRTLKKRLLCVIYFLYFRNMS
jgi:ankyrin repeat protein